MANRLGVLPADLPADAVQQHFAGRKSSPSSKSQYTTALNLWRAWLENGYAEQTCPGVRATVTDPALIKWGDLMDADGRSKGTVEKYTGIVWGIVRHTGTPADQLTEDELRAFIADRQARARGRGKELKNSYRRSILGACRAMCTALKLPDFTEGMAKGRDDTESTRPIEKADLIYLMRKAEEETRSDDEEIRAMGRIMLALLKGMSTTGLRISEAIKVLRQGSSVIVEVNGEPRINLSGTKGRHNLRDVVLLASDVFVAELDEHWGENATAEIPDWAPARAGQMFSGWALGHGVSTHPHQLRKFYGCWLYHETKDIILVKEQLRHARIKTTECYIDLVPDAGRNRVVRSFGSDLMLETPNAVPSWMENVVSLAVPATRRPADARVPF
ncbi:site-specific integrase [Streptomyces sp. T-3]|nr:site-specific integrase [Streptomyces sp. T-3]